jgi:hypothetical protein
MPEGNLAQRLGSAAKKLRAEFEASTYTRQLGNRGTEREEILKRFLLHYVSRDIDIVHQAEIITADAEPPSPACDLVIVDKSAPVLQDLISHHIVPAECVYGVIEVKSNYTGPKLREDCEKIRKVKRLPRTAYYGEPGSEISPIFGLLFGYNSISMKTLAGRLMDSCSDSGSPETDPDGAWILDKGFLSWSPAGGGPFYPRCTDSPDRDLKLMLPVHGSDKSTVLLSLVTRLSSLIATTQLPPLRLNDYLTRGSVFMVAGSWRRGSP